jgi:hypothetical protein
MRRQKNKIMSQSANSKQPEFSPEESLQLIRQMISKTRHSVAMDSFYFLFWGWLVFLCCVGQYVLKVYWDFPQHYYVWFLMPVGGVISGIYSYRQARKQQVVTYVHSALSYLWVGLAISFIVLAYVSISGKNWQHAFTYYILLYAIGTFVSGRLLQFRPLVIGGLINFALVVISAGASYDNQLLLGALALLTSYIIPGHLLRNASAKKL